MNTHMKSLLRGANRLYTLAALGAAVILTGIGATTARASIWQLQDDFELNAPSTWRFEHAGVGGGYLDTTGNYSKSGIADAYIYSSSGFSSVGRIVSFTPFLPGRTLTAAAAIYIRPWGGNVTLNFEVIDPATWTYISLKTVTLPTTYTYQKVVTNAFIPYKKEVYVRVSVLNNGAADIDDLTVQAVY